MGKVQTWQPVEIPQFLGLRHTDFRMLQHGVPQPGGAGFFTADAKRSPAAAVCQKGPPGSGRPQTVSSACSLGHSDNRRVSDRGSPSIPNYPALCAIPRHLRWLHRSRHRSRIVGLRVALNREFGLRHIQPGRPLAPHVRPVTTRALPAIPMVCKVSDDSRRKQGTPKLGFGATDRPDRWIFGQMASSQSDCRLR